MRVGPELLGIDTDKRGVPDSGQDIPGENLTDDATFAPDITLDFCPQCQAYAHRGRLDVLDAQVTSDAGDVGQTAHFALFGAVVIAIAAQLEWQSTSIAIKPP